MKIVHFYGPTLTNSGYGCHARQIARWLLARRDVSVKFVLTPWGDTPWLLDKYSHDGLVGEIIERSISVDKDRHVPCDVSLQLMLPNEWNPTIAPVNIGITAGVETNTCNPDWIANCNSMTRVIVPSTFVKTTFTNTGNVTVPMDVVPEAFIDSIKDPNCEYLRGFSTSFNFLLFGQLTGNNPHNDRKNTFFTLKWLCEAFKDDKDVGIVIKTNAGHNTKIDRNIVTNTLKNVIKEARVGDYPRIHLMHGDMNDREVAGLYRHPQIKALVALTRGEGYGLPILEAAASGLPVIATNWSGHLDFLKYGKFIDISYTLANVHPSRIDGKIFVPGMKWAEASEQDFKKRVTKFRHNSAIPREWAADMANVLKTKFDQTSINKLYDSTIGDVLCGC